MTELNTEGNVVTKSAKFGAKKIIPIVAVVLVLAIAAAVGIGIQSKKNLEALVNSYANKVYPGVSINGVDVSGKTKEQIKTILDTSIANIKGKVITVNLDNKQYELKYSDLAPSIDENTIINEAINYEKQGTIYTKEKKIKNPVKKDITYSFKFDNKAVGPFVENIASSHQVKAVNASVSISGDDISVKPSVQGKAVDTKKLTSDIQSKIGDNINDLTVKAQYIPSNPQITSEELSKINGVISQFSTDLSSSTVARRTNVTVGANALNGTLVMPGETFSFNDVVGDSTPEKGYMSAPIYVGDKLGIGYGGGICQVSTTLYNTVIRIGIPSVERHNHSMPVHYVPLGEDATIAYGYLDYKFKNTLSYPVYIQSGVSGTTLTMRVWSNNTVNKGIQYSLSNDEYADQDFTTVYENDSTLPVGQTVVDTPGSTMRKVRVYLIKQDSAGNQLSKTQISDDTYQLVNQVVKVGTKR